MAEIIAILVDMPPDPHPHTLQATFLLPGHTRHSALVKTCIKYCFSVRFMRLVSLLENTRGLNVQPI